MRKIGLDLHGVIDADPDFFSELSTALVLAGWEVHIITGPTKTKAIKELVKFKIKFTHFFSIEDYHSEKGTSMSYDDKGNPWMDKIEWERTKGEYCSKMGIALHIDDSEMYRKYFKSGFAQFSG
jgi:hypothetical protein